MAKILFDIYSFYLFKHINRQYPTVTVTWRKHTTRTFISVYCCLQNKSYNRSFFTEHQCMIAAPLTLLVMILVESRSLLGNMILLGASVSDEGGRPDSRFSLLSLVVSELRRPLLGRGGGVTCPSLSSSLLPEM